MLIQAATLIVVARLIQRVRAIEYVLLLVSLSALSFERHDPLLFLGPDSLPDWRFGNSGFRVSLVCGTKLADCNLFVVTLFTSHGPAMLCIEGLLLWLWLHAAEEGLAACLARQWVHILGLRFE